MPKTSRNVIFSDSNIKTPNEVWGGATLGWGEVYVQGGIGYRGGGVWTLKAEAEVHDQNKH